MNIIQIYDLNTKNDELQILIDKLKSVGVQIDKYDVTLDSDEISKNIKIKRLYDAYGKAILPITMVNGEIVKVEEHLSSEEIIEQANLSMKKIIKAGIEIKTNMCNINKKCGGCSCTKSDCGSCGGCKSTNSSYGSCGGCGGANSGCSSCDGEKQCCQNKLGESK